MLWSLQGSFPQNSTHFYPQLWTISEDFCWSLHSSSHPLKNSMHSICEVDWRIHPVRSSPEISQQISRFLESSPYSIPMFVQSCLNMSPYWSPNLDSEIPKVLAVKDSKFMWHHYFWYPKLENPGPPSLEPSNSLVELLQSMLLVSLSTCFLHEMVLFWNRNDGLDRKC